MNNIEAITFKNLETLEEKDYQEPYEMYYDEGGDQYVLTTHHDGHLRHHILSAKKWIIKYLG